MNITPRVIVLDFDGVITIAGEIAKERGWDIVAEELVRKGFRADIPQVLVEKRQKFANGKGDRFDILYAVAAALDYSGDDAACFVKECADLYDVTTRRFILESGVYEETRQALRDWNAAKIPIYVVSATSADAVKKSAQALELLGFFKEVRGFPRKKPEHLLEIIAQENVQPAELVFVGDSEGDYETAQTVRCVFVGVGNDWNKWASTNKPFPVVSRLTEIRLKE